MRKIAVVTGSRAEYGLLYWLMKGLKESDKAELQVLVTGMHLESFFGNTFEQIEKDGFMINAKIPVLEKTDEPAAIARAVARGVAGFSDAFSRLTPDLVVVLGDRFEILAATQAALLMRIPVAHIHGGEVTEGAVDESIRHAITKMAQVHFVTAEEHKRRVTQLGENPKLVFNFGAPGLDNLAKLKLLNRTELETDLKFKLRAPVALVTFHPETLSDEPISTQMDSLFSALENFNGTVCFTKPNADSGGLAIASAIDKFVSERPAGRHSFVSLGQLRYLSLMKEADVVVGNSSSGLIEAPFFGKPTVNIGDRQKGRLRGKTVIDVPAESGQIVKALQKALSGEFKKKIEGSNSPYGQPGASEQMLKVLETVSLEALRKKHFFDLQQ